MTKADATKRRPYMIHSAPNRYLHILIVGTLLCSARPAVSEGLPDFTFDRVVVDPGNYESKFPRKDIVAPNVIKATDYFENPLGTYYMYAGPHDHGGGEGYGIGLLYSDSLRGPWIVHGQVVGDAQAASSVFWDDVEERILLISHGPNRHNHIYESEDGISFSYIRETTEMDPQPFGYGRVFQYTLPDRDNKYVLLINWRTNNPGYAGIAVSNDGVNWETVDERVYYGEGEDPEHVTAHSPFLLNYGGKRYVILVDFWNTKELWICEVNDDLTVKENLGTFVSVADGDPVYDTRISYPFVYQENDSLYLFVAIGDHQRQVIALLTAPIDATQIEQISDVGPATIGRDARRPKLHVSPIQNLGVRNVLSPNGRKVEQRKAVIPVIGTGIDDR